MPFSNVQLEVSELPSIEEVEFTGLNKDYLLVSLLSIVFIFLVFASIGFVAYTFNSDEELIREFLAPKIKWISLAFLSIAILSLLISYFGFFRKGYAIREKDISYKNGLFWRSQVIVPFNRIQHSEVNQGPVERLFNLSTVQVYTAGGSSSDLSIHGLKQAEAMRIKQYINTKTRGDEEE